MSDNWLEDAPSQTVKCPEGFRLNPGKMASCRACGAMTAYVGLDDPMPELRHKADCPEAPEQPE